MLDVADATPDSNNRWTLRDSRCPRVRSARYCSCRLWTEDTVRNGLFFDDVASEQDSHDRKKRLGFVNGSFDSYPISAS